MPFSVAWSGGIEMSDIDYDKLRAVRRLCNLRSPPDKPQCPDERCVWLLDGQVCTFDHCVNPKRFELEEGGGVDNQGRREHKA